MDKPLPQLICRLADPSQGRTYEGGVGFIGGGGGGVLNDLFTTINADCLISCYIKGLGGGGGGEVGVTRYCTIYVVVIPPLGAGEINSACLSKISDVSIEK